LMEGVIENEEFINKEGLTADNNSNISLRGVYYKYECENANTLQNINFNINSNKTIGIVGESGSGKSTLLSLITGIIKPTMGNLFLNGVSYDSYNMSHLRSRIGYVTQESVIFDDSIINNITLWDDHVDMDRVIECSKQALAYDFIIKKPNKFDEYLGTNGLNLSGGQRQRIIIARELYKKSQILIFDEATSALDSDSEKQIQKSIEELKGKKTIIIVTHRLFSIKACDEILFLEKGTVIASGSFEGLIAKSENFRNIYNSQNL